MAGVPVSTSPVKQEASRARTDDLPTLEHVPVSLEQFREFLRESIVDFEDVVLTTPGEVFDFREWGIGGSPPFVGECCLCRADNLDTTLEIMVRWTGTINTGAYLEPLCWQCWNVGACLFVGNTCAALAKLKSEQLCA